MVCGWGKWRMCASVCVRVRGGVCGGVCAGAHGASHQVNMRLSTPPQLHHGILHVRAEVGYSRARHH